MDLHENARSCPASREVMVKRVVEEGWAVSDVARAAGVSRRIVYRWVGRWLQLGIEGLRDRSSRPHHSPARTAEEVLAQIRALREQRLSGGEIACRLGLPRTTVGRWLQRFGLGRLPQLAPPEPLRRYQKEHPGELLHLDIKKLGRIDGVGHRITGDRSTRKRGIGWDFTHVAIDDASRLAYVEVLPDELGSTAAGFFERAVAWFSQRGILVHKVLTDNGSCYRSHTFNQLCSRLGIRHSRTRPYRPRTNGKAERFIQTLLREWAYASTFTSSAARIEQLVRYLHFYNHHRAHSALNRTSPIVWIGGNNLVGIDS